MRSRKRENQGRNNPNNHSRDDAEKQRKPISRNQELDRDGCGDSGCNEQREGQDGRLTEQGNRRPTAGAKRCRRGVRVDRQVSRHADAANRDETLQVQPTPL